MRDRNGKVHKISNLTAEHRLDMTPFPCGWCLPCRINKARTWQHRIMLEAKSHVENSFITLTYSDETVPLNDSGDLVLHKPDLQNYMKRLRKRINNEKIRFFGVGEYGDKSDRPHYHVCLFGVGINDIKAIENAWSIRSVSQGIVHVGQVTPESARYIAGYTIKKLTKSTDERLHGRTPEFMVSSRRNGGIGLHEVLRIARRLKESPYFDMDQVINSFTIGGKTFPLGGYLSSKLFDELGIDKTLKEEKLREYQDKIFMDNAIHTGNYYENIIESSYQYRKKLEKRHKLNKKERII